MYGWGGSRKPGPPGTADADTPSQATLERRRQADLAFIQTVRTASEEELLRMKAYSKGWHLVAIERRLRFISGSAGT